MRKILLIEDNLTSRSLLKTLLELDGYSTAFYDMNNQGGIIQYIQQEKPDLVMMDVHLEKMNGIEILKEIRSEPSLKATNVLMLSGMDVSAECIKAGADGFFIKPYMPDDLLAWLKEHLS